MASKRIQGITIEIDGDVTKLNKALSEVDKNLSSTNAALRDVNKLLKLDPKNTELLTQKQGLLKKAIGETKTRLEELKKAQGQATDPQDYDVLQREIFETEKKLESLTKEYKNFGTVQGQQIQAAGKKLKELGDKISGVGQSLTTKLTVPIAAAFTAAGKSASDYEENLNKIDTAFGGSAESVKKWADSARKNFGLSKVAATQAASGFGALAKGIGLAEEPAAEVSTTLAGLSSDLSSYFNVGTDESAKALEGIFTGESEALKKFGVVMTETNLEKFAADHGKVWKEASQSEKVMLRYQYVLEKTKDAQGDYARTSTGTANSFRTFQATLQDLATVIGQKLLPIITPLIQKITAWVEKFAEMNPKTAELVVKIGLLLAALGPVLSILGPLVSGFGSILRIVGKVAGGFGTITGAISGGGGLITALGGLVTSFGPYLAIAAAAVVAGVAIYKNWNKIVKAGKALAKGIGKICKDIGNAISSFAKSAAGKLSNGLKAMGTVAKNTWNGIKTGATNAWKSITSTVSNAVTGMKTKFSNGFTAVKTTVTNAWKGITTAISSGINNVKTKTTNGFNAIKTSMSTAWTNISTAASKAWSNIKKNVSGAVSGIAKTAGTLRTSLSTAMSNAGRAMVSAFSNAKTTMQTAFVNLRNNASNALSSIKTAATNAFSAIKSKYSGSFGSVIESIRSKFAGIGQSIVGPFTKAWNTIKQFPSKLRSLFSGVHISLPKIKMPHFTVTWKQIGNLFRIPKISVQWYRKAYENAVMFNRPTVLQTPYGAKGFGDGPGGEVVLGMDKLKQLVGAAGDTNVVINVTAPQGMNVNQLADAIQRRLANVQQQKAYSMT